MPSINQAVVAAGGKGFRMGPLAAQYGNKSLILIEGKPIIAFTVEALLKAGLKKIVVAVDGESNYDQMCRIFRGKRRVRVVQDKGTGETGGIPVNFDYLLEKKFLFIYGNAPPLASHVKAMAQQSADAVVSLFPFSSSRTPIVAELDGTRVKRIKSQRNVFGREAFVEPPYILSKDFVPFLAQHRHWFDALKAYAESGKTMVGVPALMPPNVHYPHEVSLLLSHLLKYAGTDYELRIE
ncbi:NTP transferase domain-containing protein [Candidatus Micrarchaeota archaeon]|nr:NTP transferase domain-containing protein [Candidatus Micrarchaeota archaeon]